MANEDVQQLRPRDFFRESTADIASVWQNLFDAGVPVADATNMAYVTKRAAYNKMLADSAFTSEAVVGSDVAHASLHPLLETA